MTIHWERLLRNLQITPRAVFALVTALLVISATVGLLSDRANRGDAAREATVQAEILASSVAGALAFDDAKTARDYLGALAANPRVQAAAAYGMDGSLVAAFDGAASPPAKAPPVGARYRDGRLEVSTQVRQGTTNLGWVYLQLAAEAWPARAVQYLAVAAIIAMASLLILVLGTSQIVLRETNRRLERETEERHAAESALRQSQKMEAMGQLTGGVAHDFNNLLMVASSGLDLLERTNDPDRRRLLKDGIRQAIDRGASLTQQLLAFARRAPVKPEVIDPASALRGMLNLLERSLREDVTVDLQIPSGLWPVEVDPSAFEVAILNMAINARDAMPEGGVITIHAENRNGDGGDLVRICITDTGVGLAPEVAARVFEPFFTTKEVGRGTGLGLSQVYGFAQSSGGDVEFVSELGKGATVCVLLPRTHKSPPVGAKLAGLAELPVGYRPRVLLVEDDDHVAELVSQMLTELGFQFERAATAGAALAMLGQDTSYDLVFSDMVMPGEMHGLELFEQIERLYPQLPVILTTGYSNAAASAAARGVRLLVKPYRMDALARELRAALNLSGTGSAPEPSAGRA